MRERLLDILRCSDCGGVLELTAFQSDGLEISTGILHCPESHYFPVYKGIPRMLPNSLTDYWTEIEKDIPDPVPPAVLALVESKRFRVEGEAFDKATQANFSNEWDNHDIGGKTWTMELKDRIQWFFLDSIRIPKEELKGKLLLDAGCGNGSQSVAYTEFGLEVVALDLSTGLEKGQAFREVYEKANPENVHFVQADLQKPPLRADCLDIIHSAGVLHHTPNTLKTFRALRPLLKTGGTFYVWLYKFEKIVTPIVNTMRAITTRIPAPIFARVADITALPFIGFCWSVNKLGVRKYETPNRREAALAVHDIFGAPYAHYHNFDEVSGWYKSAGFNEIWGCNDDRRGFGVCGRLPVNGE
jgi:SAM-dependent methyltransferase/uncharacterized protein YbaR (Trm112 family)